jgi:hypothetical protein
MPGQLVSEKSAMGAKVITSAKTDMEDRVIASAKRFQKLVEFVDEYENIFFKSSNENVDWSEEVLRLRLTYLEQIQHVYRGAEPNMSKIMAKIDDIRRTWSDLKGRRKERFYKIQMLAEILQFQKKFCPGGFKPALYTHMEHLDHLLQELYTQHHTKVVFSNEAVAKKRLGFIQKTVYLQHVRLEKDMFSVSFLSDTLTFVKNGTFGMATYGTGSGRLFFWTSHEPSTKIPKRDTKSNEFCKNLSGFMDDIIHKSGGIENFGGYGGDINVNLTTDDSDGLQKLRTGVQEVLDKHKLVLFVSSHKIDVHKRARVHEQWNKLGDVTGPKYLYDTLVVLEPYHKGVHQRYAHHCLKHGMSAWFPSETLSSLQTKSSNIEVFSHGITDHFVVAGLNVVIYNGADVDGISSSTKAVIVEDMVQDDLDDTQEVAALLQFNGLVDMTCEHIKKKLYTTAFTFVKQKESKYGNKIDRELKSWAANFIKKQGVSPPIVHFRDLYPQGVSPPIWNSKRLQRFVYDNSYCWILSCLNIPPPIGYSRLGPQDGLFGYIFIHSAFKSSSLELLTGGYLLRHHAPFFHLANCHVDKIEDLESNCIICGNLPGSTLLGYSCTQSIPDRLKRKFSFNHQYSDNNLIVGTIILGTYNISYRPHYLTDATIYSTSITGLSKSTERTHIKVALLDPFSGVVERSSQ